MIFKNRTKSQTSSSLILNNNQIQNKIKKDFRKLNNFTTNFSEKPLNFDNKPHSNDKNNLKQFSITNINEKKSIISNNLKPFSNIISKNQDYKEKEEIEDKYNQNNGKRSMIPQNHYMEPDLKIQEEIKIKDINFCIKDNYGLITSNNILNKDLNSKIQSKKLSKKLQSKKAPENDEIKHIDEIKLKQSNAPQEILENEDIGK